MSAKKVPSRGGYRRNAGAKPGVRLSDRHREAIKVSVLIERAQRIALNDAKRGTILDPQEEAVRARYMALLLNKALPDLVRTELTGQDGGPLEIITRAE